MHFPHLLLCWRAEAISDSSVLLYTMPFPSCHVCSNCMLFLSIVKILLVRFFSPLFSCCQLMPLQPVWADVCTFIAVSAPALVPHNVYVCPLNWKQINSWLKAEECWTEGHLTCLSPVAIQLPKAQIQGCTLYSYSGGYTNLYLSLCLGNKPDFCEKCMIPFPKA